MRAVNEVPAPPRSPASLPRAPGGGRISSRSPVESCSPADLES